MQNAIVDGDLSAVKELVEQGSDINEGDWTPLLFAAYHGKIDIVKYLVQQDADLNKPTSYGCTPIHYACSQGHIEILSFLADKGAKVDLKDKGGSTPLSYAARNQSVQVMSILLKLGADVNSITDTGETPVFSACKRGFLEGVKCLVENGADINAANSDGILPVSIALCYKQTEVLRYLVTKGTDFQKKDMNGRSPLHYACDYGDFESVRLLIDAGASLEAGDDGMFSPFCNACSYGHTTVVQLLIDKGSETTRCGWNGNTGLHLAAWKGHTTVVSVLLTDKRMQINLQNMYGCTPLHLSALGNKLSSAELLVAQGANVNTQDNNGNTPLHFAISTGSHPLIKLLLEQPSLDLHLRNYLGLNPIAHAAQCHFDGLAGDQFQVYLQDIPPNVCVPAAKFVEATQNTVPNVSLSGVKLIEIKHIQEAGEIPHYDKCELNGWHKTADQVKLGEKILFVSHRWGAVEIPDPEGMQYYILIDFLKTHKENFKYIWLDYACICQDKESVLFRIHLANIPTAVWIATHCVIIPQLRLLPYINNPNCTVSVTDLSDYLGRAWCVLESCACLLTGTKLFCSFQVGAFTYHSSFDFPEGASSRLGFYEAFSLAWQEINQLPENEQTEFLNIGVSAVYDKWHIEETCRILAVLVRISSSTDAGIICIRDKARNTTLQLEDVTASTSDEIKELWKLLGNCAFEEDKVIVFRLMLLIGFYALRPKHVQDMKQIASPQLDVDASESQHNQENAGAGDNQTFRSTSREPQNVLVKSKVGCNCLLM